jgi:hypothetical protein
MMKKNFKRGLILAPFFLISCSVTAIRPSQEMSNMEVSIRAAKEVNADTLAPELYRMANEVGQSARHEYRFKNFKIAKKLADEARSYAERAEFEAIKNGAKRETVPGDPLADPSYQPTPISTPSPTDAPAQGSKPSVTVPAPQVPSSPSN